MWAFCILRKWRGSFLDHDEVELAQRREPQVNEVRCGTGKIK